ncbi:MAG: phage portal protein [Eubacterium sp.]
MALKDLFKKIKKGVMAGMAVVTAQDQILTDNRILYLIDEFKNSAKRTWMFIGKQYYEVDNDILSRRITKKVNGKNVEETYKANNKIAHAKYKGQVDEKVSYLLAKPYTLKCEDEAYADKLKDLLGRLFNYNLSLLGYDASNCGISWLLPYIDEGGNFKTMVVPAEQCVPIWTDSSHTELTAMIRVYDIQTWKYSKKEIIHNVEYWTADSYRCYKLQSGLLVPYTSENSEENGPVAHFRKGAAWQGWGKVPFIPFKNNHVEIADIKFVKSLIDQYDLSRSEAANYIEEVKNIIFVLKGYGGEDLDEFMRGLNEDRAIPIDDPQEGGVDTLTPTMDITAIREHYEQLKRDIAEDGQSISKDLDKYGNSPSGVALKFMYAGLDLKADALETQFRLGFEQLLYFVDCYLELVEGNSQEHPEVEVIFNRNMKINESEAIDNCAKSKSTISEKTILANHPYVKDVDLELELLAKQSEREAFDEIPIKDQEDER